MASMPPWRKIRSFVKRPGRLTAAQARARTSLLPRYSLAAGSSPIDLDQEFGRHAPHVLEIGFGDGESLVTAAINHAELDYLGVEVHEPGIGHALLLLERAGVANVRIVEGDAVELLSRFAAASFAAVNLFFPDPWPKKRHHKRRIVQAPFLAALARVLSPGGLLHVATDWADYAEHVQAVLAASREFTPVDARALGSDPLAFRAPSKFERRGRQRGHVIVDLFYRRLSAALTAPEAPC
jgi:tRNA (guanine-N7-)-methyltransferase